MAKTPSFSAPIPGQSLTTPPKARAYERPPELSNVTEVMDFYINRLGDQSVIDDLFVALENGFPLSTLVDSITANGVMEGKHSIDISMLVSPVIHEYIRVAAKAGGVSVKEFPTTKQDADNERNKEALKVMLMKSLDEIENEDEGTEILEEALEYVEKEPTPEDRATEVSGIAIITDDMKEEKEASDIEMSPQEEEPKGLMSRRN
tara:strand:+ start:2602 stop:3216 length:615 start_codon:yes stop_codon:yes gene_type:complete